MASRLPMRSDLDVHVGPVTQRKQGHLRSGEAERNTPRSTYNDVCRQLTRIRQRSCDIENGSLQVPAQHV